jgi:protein required for attachment to host cells
MKSTWILVADSTRARYFTASTPSSALQELEDDIHPAGRQHERDMTSDLPGKARGAGGAGGHAYEESTDIKEYESTEFAKEIARHLEEALNAGKYRQLLIVAAPSFLGELRNQTSERVRKLVCFELDKNLATHSAEDIRKHLPEYLPNR